MQGVLLALAAGAKCLPGLGNVYHLHMLYAGIGGSEVSVSGLFYFTKSVGHSETITCTISEENRKFRTARIGR